MTKKKKGKKKDPPKIACALLTKTTNRPTGELRTENSQEVLMVTAFPKDSRIGWACCTRLWICSLEMASPAPWIYPVGRKKTCAG